MIILLRVFIRIKRDGGFVGRNLVGLVLLVVFTVSGLLSFASAEEENTLNAPEAKEALYITDAHIRNHKLDEFFWRPNRFKPDLFGLFRILYNNTLPQDLKMDLKYNQYPYGTQFGVALKEGIFVRALPKLSSSIVVKRSINSKFTILGIVHGEYLAKYKTDDWYAVEYTANGKTATGYVFSGFLTKRAFQYKEMLKTAKAFSEVINNNATTAHISNYKNRNGRPPKINNLEVDAFGYQRDQSAPGYSAADLSSDFRYLSDGRLLIIKSDVGEFYLCSHPYFEGEFYIPKKYVTLHEAKNAISQFIVIDRINQTEVALEKRPDGWAVVSQNLVTTGEKATFKDETERGIFYIIEKRSKFIYLDDVTKEVDGYAPYALRFNGGAYTHGVPVNFKKITEKVLVTPEIKDAAGVVLKPAVYEEKVKERKDPGMIEYLSTIGTIPRSHKCVRHHTSNALFLYEWVNVGQAVMVVLE